MFCRSLFVLLSFSWPLCCLFFFDLRLLITPLVSSNSSWIRSMGYSESDNIAWQLNSGGIFGNFQVDGYETWMNTTEAITVKVVSEKLSQWSRMTFRMSMHMLEVCSWTQITQNHYMYHATKKLNAYISNESINQFTKRMDGLLQRRPTLFICCK
jgi:hypothetical protein